MCKSKAQGGERCAAHLREEMNSAMATAKAEPSKENLSAMKDAMDAYNRTPTGIKELRSKGDAASVALANRNDAERKEKRAMRKAAQYVEANKTEYEGKIHARLYSSETNSVKRYDENFSGQVFQDFAVGERGEDGRVKAVFTYDEVWDREGRGQMYALDGVIDIKDFSNPETLDDDLEKAATQARDAHYPELSDNAGAAQADALSETFGEDYEKFVDAEVEINSHASARDVRDYYEDRINDLSYADFEDLDDDDVKVLSTHPLASDDTKEKALEELEDRAS